MRKMLTCSGERIAFHSSSALVLVSAMMFRVWTKVNIGFGEIVVVIKDSGRVGNDNVAIRTKLGLLYRKPIHVLANLNIDKAQVECDQHEMN